mmetsp:Transcript_7496/g.8656  ORF Transcript_7496/g.8656 Transcript_7496/m.8656 type:complete len:632 (-) Transcript_7496:445-2340(-)|eukprot:CAMPEP_0197851890 /NCGR_PEP_ID=MMETSP1438-20131217/19147_1 /TAXON_ID=1461541 /ORGANISM="Pterosperma sp., Strain CCMP1384" /LENGTH=631 /DNA_ID=CAMNT_0043465673 /DNA_START=29 /DNA_END=1924 /DNA_ORIENTATION=+
MEVSYLKDTIGDALNNGCAAACVAAPADPIEFLGRWLLKYVENEKVVKQLAAEKAVAEAEEADKKAKEEAVAKDIAAKKAEKKKSIEKLMLHATDPYELWYQATEAIVQYTGASAAYVANLEEPTPQLPEVGDESEDEEAEDEAEGEAAEPEAPGEGEEGAETEEKEVVFDYTTKMLYYTAANKGQDYILEKALLRLPIQLEEGEEPEEGAPTTKPMGVTYAIVDEGLRALDVPNVLYNQSVHYWDDFPRLGAYFAAGIKVKTGELKCIMCADSLRNQGTGKKLAEDDKDYIMAVSRQVALALDKAEEERMKITDLGMAASAAQELDLQLNPPPPEVEEGAEGEAAPPAEGEAPPEEPEEPESEEEEEEPPPEEEAPPEPAEGEEGAEDGEPPPPPPPPTVEECEEKVAKAEKAHARCERKVKKATKAKDEAVTACEEMKEKLTMCRTSLETVQDNVISEIRMLLSPPPNTFRILSAMLYILGKDKNTFANWRVCRLHITPETMNEIKTYDATQPRDMTVWKSVRQCLKDVKPEDLQGEAIIGDLLRVYILYVKNVAKAAALQREKEEALAAAEVARGTAAEAIEAAQAELKEAQERAAEEAGEEAPAEGEGEGGEGGEAPAEGEEAAPAE